MKVILFRLIDENGQTVGYEKWDCVLGWCYALPIARDTFRPGPVIPHVKKDLWTGVIDLATKLVYENDILQWLTAEAEPKLAIVTYTDYLTGFELRNDALKIRCGVGLMVKHKSHAPVVAGNAHEKRYADLLSKIKLYGGLPK
jgi:hypothetical protein